MTTSFYTMALQTNDDFYWKEAANQEVRKLMRLTDLTRAMYLSGLLHSRTPQEQTEILRKAVGIVLELNRDQQAAISGPWLYDAVIFDQRAAITSAVIELRERLGEDGYSAWYTALGTFTRSNYYTVVRAAQSELDRLNKANEQGIDSDEVEQ